MEQDFIQYLLTLPPEQLKAMFEPYGQEMEMAGQLRQPGPQHSSPWGALLGGISDAVGNVGGAYQQKQVLKGMQGEAAGRTQGYLDYLRRMQAGQGATPDLTEASLLGY